MPVEFLTDEQASAYGSFREAPTRPELERFFFLDDGDCDLIALRRSEGGSDRAAGRLRRLESRPPPKRDQLLGNVRSIAAGPRLRYGPSGDDQ
jgi:hypothetical protein